jgi:hypothetical protein
LENETDKAIERVRLALTSSAEINRADLFLVFEELRRLQDVESDMYSAIF